MWTPKKTRLVLISAGLVICLSVLIPLLRAAPEQSLGTISGHVTRDGGVPAVGVTVTAFPAYRPFFRYMKDNPNTAVTDADGRYTILLQPLHPMMMSGPILPDAKGFSVFVSNGGQPYIEPSMQTADPAAVPAHVVTGIDFVLRLGPQITVYARDAITGTPDPGLSINAVDQVGRHTAMGITGPDGTLSFHIPLTEFTLQTDLPNTLEGAPGYGGGSSCGHAFKLSPGQAATWDLKTYSTGVHISDTGAKSYGPDSDSDWHGVVLGPDGQPAINAHVTILREYGTGGDLVTDSQGRFSARLPRLNYGEAEEWHTHTLPIVIARHDNLSVMQTVTPDESWDGMTLRLKPGAAFSGRLTDPQGHAAVGMAVALTGSISDMDWRAAPTTTTDDQGHFTLDGLPPGDYQIQARGGNFGGILLPATASGSPSVPTRFTLTDGQRLDLGRRVVLRADRTLAGRVVDEQGKPVARLGVTVTSAHAHENAYTLADGTFHVNQLVAEPLTVRIGASGHEVTVQVTPEQTDVHLIARPDVVATAIQPFHPPPPQPPTGPPAVATMTMGVMLNGLSLSLTPATGGGFTAAIQRPNAANPMAYGGIGFNLPSLWTGPLADIEGMRLTVRDDQGTLTDRGGHTLWSGVVWDPPDYTIAFSSAHDGTDQMSILDSHGKALWSGQTAPEASSQAFHDGDLRVIGPTHQVVWERALGNARTALFVDAPHFSLSQIMPLDGSLTLHVSSGTATLRASDGHILSSLSAPILKTDIDIPSAPAKIGADGKTNLAFTHWRDCYYFLCPPPVTPLVNVQNAPTGSFLTLTDSTGHLLDYKRSFP